MNSIVLICGVSGVGKTRVLQALCQMDGRFTPVPVYTTRALRQGETGKIHIEEDCIHEMKRSGAFIYFSEFYGFLYGTPWKPFRRALLKGLFPVIEWPVKDIHVMESTFPGRVLPVYLMPPSREELGRRLSLDGRDPDGRRLACGLQELEHLRLGSWNEQVQLFLRHDSNATQAVARAIRKAALAGPAQSHNSLA